MGIERPAIRYRASKSKNSEGRTSGVFERGQRIDCIIVQKVKYIIIKGEKIDFRLEKS